jgi:uncharacterized membrane protein YgcG
MEKLLPDARVGEIGTKMNPSLRRGDYSEALLTVTHEIATIIAQDRGVSLTSRATSPGRYAVGDLPLDPDLALLILA